VTLLRLKASNPSEERTMTQKIENEASKKNGEAVHDNVLSDRQRLVASVAGNVASGIVTAPSKKSGTAAAIAEISVDIAKEIVKRAEIT
jgi:hypothetical protein